jgi:CspA family cold shock protein
MLRGVVTSWHKTEGWGAVDASGVPGEVWVHWSMIEMSAYKTLVVDQPVWVEVEDLGSPIQDGYRYRAIRVVPASDTIDRLIS